MITALAIMIAIAGYLQFAGNSLEEEYLTVDDQNVYSRGASLTGSEGIVTGDYTTEELTGAVWVTFQNGEDKFYTRERIGNSRFDFNKYAFDSGNVYEKAFRHKLVRLIKEKNC